MGSAGPGSSGSRPSDERAPTESCRSIPRVSKIVAIALYRSPMHKTWGVSCRVALKSNICSLDSALECQSRHHEAECSLAAQMHENSKTIIRLWQLPDSDGKLVPRGGWL